MRLTITTHGFYKMGCLSPYLLYDLTGERRQYGFSFVQIDTQSHQNNPSKTIRLVRTFHQPIWDSCLCVTMLSCAMLMCVMIVSTTPSN